ncbi:hypothetical protein M422DRAFT_240281 [Sphaerobolus stellatus SS14]|nr:hypothetical protein M422DRAFT_240281 [Sphaerobolus stellatus SS14]
MSHASSSGNAADLLSQFHDQQAKHDENHIEVGAIFGACFVYHPTGCNQCSTYVEHLPVDIEQCPAKFSFSKNEILDSLHEAWPHISGYIADLNEERITLEKELDDEKADNHRLRSDMDDLNEKIQMLEAQLSSLQPPAQSGDRSLTQVLKTGLTRASALELLKDTNFQNRVRVPEVQPDYWSLYMWNTLKDWHTNPMSIPNAIRDDSDSYFLEEDIDVTAWISKISVDITHPAFMYQMKVEFSSRDNFNMAFSGFSQNLLQADHEASMWITDSSTPLQIGSNIVKGHTSKSQNTTSEKLPKGPDFLVLVLNHCSLTRQQIYTCIIPYMIWHEEKQPCSGAGSERAAYMHLNQSVHVPTPAKTGESSQQRLDVDLDSYNQVRELVLPYEEAPPSSTLPDESTMDIDPELDDLYS